MAESHLGISLITAWGKSRKTHLTQNWCHHGSRGKDSPSEMPSAILGNVLTVEQLGNYVLKHWLAISDRCSSAQVHFVVFRQDIDAQTLVSEASSFNPASCVGCRYLRSQQARSGGSRRRTLQLQPRGRATFRRSMCANADGDTAARADALRMARQAQAGMLLRRR